ncbi:alpha/beta hydrolase [Aliivibrio logei]|uniref:Alpha/beta hydrolase n=1 Tax=Aliivibrio logei TaxID=688 RepID=A0A1B9NW21_ALILO|nr:alpha/beta hydrolase [Aliivibrio logei]OCH19270.1 alpha/beta hydrolase [Aliivibrio logei]
MLIERWLDIDGDKLYCLSTPIKDSRETLVFIHGLGESHLCFSEAIDWLPNYNLIMFDLCGYGYSPVSVISHTTEIQAKRVLKALEQLNINKCFLLGHSWGGDISTLICDYDKKSVVCGFINAEGGLHAENIILSQIIAEKYSALEKSEFSNWVKGDGFSKRFPMSWSHAAGINYLSSVRRCNPIVLGETASEIYAQHSEQDIRGVVGWGRVYESLTIPKVYFWGTQSLEGCSRAVEFISTLDNVSFKGANHWVQNDPSNFYLEVDKFIGNVQKHYKTFKSSSS